MIRLSKIDGELSILKENKVVIFGAGELGKYVKRLLNNLNIKECCFCDNDHNKWGTFLLDTPIISIDELKKCYDECTIILISVNEKIVKTIQKQLCDNNMYNYLCYDELDTRVYHNKWYKIYCNEKYRKEIYYKHWINWTKWFGDKCKNLCLEYVAQVVLCDKKIFNYICLPPKTGDHTLDSSGVIGFNWSHTYRHMNEIIQGVIGNKTIKIITAVREPISQNLSSFFENITTLNCNKEYWNDGGDVQLLFDAWINHELGSNLCRNKATVDDIKMPILEMQLEAYGVNSFSIQHWFENNFEPYSGIDVYKLPFDKDKGYSIYKIPEKNVEIFIYQLERLNDLEKEIGDFFEIENFHLVNSYMGEDKWYSDAYKQAKKEIKISREYFDFCMNSKLMNHFYSDADIKKFREKWESHIED